MKRPVSEFAETESLGGGLHQMTIHSAPIAYKEAGKWNRIDTTWEDTGDSKSPHAVTKSPLKMTVGDDGERKIYPTQDPNKWVSIGAPCVDDKGKWGKLLFSSASKGTGANKSKLAWSRPETDLSIVHGGHFTKLDIELKGGYVPPGNQFAFPINTFGLTLSGNQILDGEKAVAMLQVPVAYDAANLGDVRPIDSKFIDVGGQAYLCYTLPDLAGMTRPVVDPTVTVVGDSGDAWIYGDNGTYATARSTSAGLTTGTNSISIGQTSNYYVYRGFLKFDTSTFPKATIITKVNMMLTAIVDNSAADFDIQIVKQNWSGQDPLAAGTREAAYDGCLSGTADSAIWRNTSGMSLNTQYTSGDLAVSWINRTGNTYYSLRSSRDAGNNTPTGLESIQLAAQEHATGSYRPQLVITYRLLNPVIHF